MIQVIPKIKVNTLFNFFIKTQSVAFGPLDITLDISVHRMRCVRISTY